MARLELRFGVAVTDGQQEYGSLAAVTMEERSLYWNALIVHRGLIRVSEGIVPRGSVLEADDQRIVIAKAPAAGAARSYRAISGDSMVRRPDDTTYGRVIMLLAAENGRLLHIVMERSPFLEPKMIPVESVVAIEPAAVIVDLSPEAVDELPPYRRDGDLASDARQEVQTLARAPSSERGLLRVDVVDGAALLSGHIRLRSWAEQIEAAVGAVPGVLCVDNQLICDDELAQEAADALAAIPHAHEYAVACRVDLGVVILSGRADSAGTAKAATEILAEIPAVRGIVNRIVAPGFLPDEKWTDPPAIGEPIYAGDGLVGTVERVVIDPRRRAFVGIVAEVALMGDGGSPLRPGRKVFIARANLRAAAEAGVFLEEDMQIALEESSADDVAEPAPSEWQPPFPYRTADVAWPATAAWPVYPASVQP